MIVVAMTNQDVMDERELLEKYSRRCAASQTQSWDRRQAVAENGIGQYVPTFMLN